MIEKFENSSHSNFANDVSIHDCKIIEPKGMSHKLQIALLGLGTTELVFSFANIYPILLTTLTGLGMVISGIGEANPAELMGGIGTITAASIASRLTKRGYDRSEAVFEEVTNSLRKENLPQHKM